MNVKLTAAARRDLFRLLDWLEQLSPAAARKAADAILGGLAELGDYPLSGRAIDSSLRDKLILFSRDGFVVRYRVEAGDLVVFRIFHGRQKRQPGDPESFARIVEGLGYEVAEAGDGDEGLKACRAAMPDAILVDGNLPTMTGFDFVRRLRGERGGTRRLDGIRNFIL